MTDRQAQLMPYVESMTKEVLAVKEKSGIRPLIAMYTDIISDIRTDVLECMRELHRSGRYDGVNTLNQPALKKNV